MVKMKALMQFPYFGKNLEPGAPFEASESDAHALQLTGRAEVDGNRADAETHANADPRAAGDQAYLTRDMAAAGTGSRRNRKQHA